MTVHNFSTYKLTQHDLQLLNKGLSFSPNNNTIDQQQILQDFNKFAQTLRLKYARVKHTKPQTPEARHATVAAYLYRPMKFIPPTKPDTAITRFSGFPRLEIYIDNTKQRIADNLSTLTKSTKQNITKEEHQSLVKLQHARREITIKPADKNLGVVLLDTNDYISQCLKVLTDSKTYRLTTEYPTRTIQAQLGQVTASFKNQLTAFSKYLYTYISVPQPHPRIPKFYGIPKVHKEFTHLPPMRPIVSQSASLLEPTAKFLDHVLQPICRTFPDFLQNSTTLANILQDLYVPDDAILVTIDVNNLYPSIPQTECLAIIYDELHIHRHLLTFNPNLIIKLLHVNINNNYFSFGHATFQQITGTAMGAPFSPSMANIFMSVTIAKFLQTQQIKPHFLTRYIDDIFIIWTGTPQQLDLFLDDLNKFHSNLQFTNQQSTSSIDFLDLTIYKGQSFQFTNILDTKTFQKQLNLYQYLHFTSNHPKKVFKALIKGECIRYIRTNSTPESYTATVYTLQKRLMKRNYPKAFINKVTASVQYKDRQKYLKQTKPQLFLPKPPVYKCIAPPQFHQLKQLVIQEYSTIHFLSPRFIPLRSPTLQNKLIRAKIQISDDQLVDLILALDPNTTSSTQTIAAALPKLKSLENTTKMCKHPRCATCRIHLNRSSMFRSNYPLNKTTYVIRHTFSCQSKNIVYLISCAKCKKQYVGSTTQQLNTRINHHRSSILNKKSTYIHKHFNLPDHHITHLRVQPIDTTSPPDSSVQDLRKLESFWIATLRTKKPIRP